MHDQSIQHNITLTTRCGGGAPRATLRLLVDEQSLHFVDFSLLLLLLLFFLSFFPPFLVRMVVLLLNWSAALNFNVLLSSLMKQGFTLSLPVA